MIKRFDEKKLILEQYQQIINSFDKMQIIAIYLKYIIDNVESDKDIFELDLDIPLITNQFTVDGDKIFRFQHEIDKLFNKLNINHDDLSDERFIEVSKRLLKYAKPTNETT